MSLVYTAYSNTNGSQAIRIQNKPWATIKAASSADVLDTDEADIRNTSLGGGQYDLGRLLLPFDISDFSPTGKNITSVVLYLYYFLQSGITNNNSISHHVVQTTQANPTGASVDDWNNFSFVSGGSKTLASYSSNSFNAISLNDTAIQWVKDAAGGYLKLGLIGSPDLNNNPPGGTNTISILRPDYGQVTDPYLRITYRKTKTLFFLQ